MHYYTVHIRVNGEEWGEYRILAKNRETSCFLAGMKFQREETSYAGDYITADSVPDPTNEEVI